MSQYKLVYTDSFDLLFPYSFHVKEFLDISIEGDWGNYKLIA